MRIKGAGIQKVFRAIWHLPPALWLLLYYYSIIVNLRSFCFWGTGLALPTFKSLTVKLGFLKLKYLQEDGKELSDWNPVDIAGRHDHHLFIYSFGTHSLSTDQVPFCRREGRSKGTGENSLSLCLTLWWSQLLSTRLPGENMAPMLIQLSILLKDARNLDFYKLQTLPP